MCSKHYQAWRLRNADKIAKDKQPLYIVDEDGCWLRTARVDEQGYAYVHVEGTYKGKELAHRWAYRKWVGPIQDGYSIDHACHDPNKCNDGPKCKHRRCMNPDHLRQMPLTENVSRKKRDACKYGHKYTPENTYLRKEDGSRVCRACRNAQQRAHTARKRAAD